MLLSIIMDIENKVKKYTEAYRFGNDHDLNVCLWCSIDEEDKEHLLDLIDRSLPYGTNFEHTYNERGILTVTFKTL